MVNLGLIVSVYDEVEETNKTINTFKQKNFPIIVIQSNPKNAQKIIDSKSVDYYKLFPDFAGSKDQYIQERTTEGSTTPTKALTRNFNKAFSISKTYDIDWWIVICGDVVINNIIGIEKILQKMIKENKFVGMTRAIGQIFRDENDKLTRIQDDNATDFMPQFFIVNHKCIKNGLFNNILITNPFTTEQCMGDEVKRYCVKNNMSFHDLCYIIADYAYPQFIEGLQYNSDRITMPHHIDTIVNRLRRFKLKILK